MELSIVVVCVSRPETRERSLAALVAQAVPAGAEMLVVGRPADRPADPAPGYTWIEATPDETVPRMRARGIRAARGRVVALLEDDCVVADGWCAAVLAGHGQDVAVVGGPIEPDRYARALDWAIFFCEYARFLPPLDGAVAALPGNNVSYRRALVLEWLEGRDGFVEAFAHGDWRGRGIPLVASGGMRVTNVNRWTRDGRHAVRVPSWPRVRGRALPGGGLPGTAPALRRRKPAAARAQDHARGPRGPVPGTRGRVASPRASVDNRLPHQLGDRRAAGLPPGPGPKRRALAMTRYGAA